MQQRTNTDCLNASLNNEWSLKASIDACGSKHLEQATVSPRYEESVFTFENPGVLRGSIRTFITPDMEISRLEVSCIHNLTVTAADNVERSVSNFLLTGAIHSHVKDVNVKIEQSSQQHLFMHAHVDESMHTLLAGDTSVVYINMKPAVLQSYFPNWQQLTKGAYKRRDSKTYFSSLPLSINATSRTRSLLSSLYEDSFCSATRSLFIEAKAMELVALQMEDILQLADTHDADDFLNKEDKEKLAALYQYINVHFLEPLSLASLARKFTLNEFKLKKGFRLFYDQSVFNYILTLRMHRAKQLLASDYTVTEVADTIGYSGVQSFSNAFYKMYGYRPGKLKPLKTVYA